MELSFSYALVCASPSLRAYVAMAPSGCGDQWRAEAAGFDITLYRCRTRHGPAATWQTTRQAIARAHQRQRPGWSGAGTAVPTARDSAGGTACHVRVVPGGFKLAEHSDHRAADPPELARIVEPYLRSGRLRLTTAER